MGITDELREWAHGFNGPWRRNEEMLLAIADRIDEEHERGMADAELSAAPTEAQLSELGYIKLPLGADGEVIRIGDVVIAQLLFGGESKPLVVDRMELSRGRDGYLWCVALDTDKECWNQPSLLRHYQPPTVEDVLREFAERVCNSGHRWGGLDAADTIAEYAAKLRLAGDAE